MAPPSEVNKIWKISKRSGRLEVFCNGQKMLDYKFDEGVQSGCATQWGLDAARIKFPGSYKVGSEVDTASDMYAVVQKRLISKFRFFARILKANIFLIKYYNLEVGLALDEPVILADKSNPKVL